MGVTAGVSVKVGESDAVIDSDTVSVTVGVRVTVNVPVPTMKVLVAVIVGVKVGVPAYGVSDGVTDSENVGDGQKTLAVTILELFAPIPAPPIMAMFAMSPQETTVPHHVRVPPSFDKEPRFHLSMEPAKDPICGPAFPMYTSPVGIVSHMLVAAETAGENIIKLS